MRSSTALPALLLAFVVVPVAACGDDSETSSTSTATSGGTGGDAATTTNASTSSTASVTTSGGEGGGDGGQGGAGAGGDGGAGGQGGGGGGDPIQTIATADGILTIAFTSDSNPETDCTVTYDVAAVEDRSVPWLFPDADLAFVATPDTSASTCDEPTDWFLRFGWNDDGDLFFAPENNLGLEVGTVTLDGDTVTLDVDADFDFEGEYDLQLAGEGTLTLGTTDDDPLHGFRRSQTYSCEWPRTDPPPFDGDFAASIGAPLPDGVFTDVCGDNVRLHDLTGRYLVLLASPADDSCGPCIDMRNGVVELEDALADLDVETLTVSLLNGSLSDLDTPATPEDLLDWQTTSGTNGVVLADRFYMSASLASATDFALLAMPGWMLVAPDGTVLGAELGYSRGQTPDDIVALIEEDAGE